MNLSLVSFPEFIILYFITWFYDEVFLPTCNVEFIATILKKFINHYRPAGCHRAVLQSTSCRSERCIQLKHVLLLTTHRARSDYQSRLPLPNALIYF